MKQKVNEVMGTESVRIDTGVLELVRLAKKHTGFPIGRFIEEAIAEKVKRLPKKTQEKMGLIKL